MKELDSGACPGLRSGIRRNDKRDNFPALFKGLIVKSRIENPNLMGKVIPLSENRERRVNSSAYKCPADGSESLKEEK